MSNNKKGLMFCPHCNGEIGLRERYERLLDLLQAGLVVFDANNKFEQNSTNSDLARNVMAASVQMYNIIAKYWEDIPGETIEQKLQAIEEKRILEKDENGKFVVKKEKEEQLIITEK